MLMPHRRPPVLDGALHGARREHRAHARRQLPDVAAAAVGRSRRARLARPARPSASCMPRLHAKRYDELDAARGASSSWSSDESNPSSISPACSAARENARAVRGTLTTEVWETQNQTWLEVQPHAARAATSSATRAQFFEWVKFRSHLSRGVTLGTMLQDEAFHFSRLGTFLERADNTARLLDVKFHARQQRVLRHRQPRRTRSTTSITGARSCARSRPSRSTARSIAT